MKTRLFTKLYVKFPSIKKKSTPFSKIDKKYSQEAFSSENSVKVFRFLSLHSVTEETFTACNWNSVSFIISCLMRDTIKFSSLTLPQSPFRIFLKIIINVSEVISWSKRHQRLLIYLMWKSVYILVNSQTCRVYT